MLRTLLAMACGLVIAITIGMLLPNRMGLWANYLAVAAGAAVSSLMVRCRQWLFGALLGVMFGGFTAACLSWVLASFKRFYGMQPDYHAYVVVAVHTLGYAVVGAALSELAPRILRR